MAALVLLVALLLVVGPRLDLGSQRAQIERLLSQTLGRQVEIEGAVELRISLQPRLSLQGLRIANPPGWQESTLLRAEALSASVALLPLLQRRLELTELSGHGIHLDLMRDEGGAVNWELPALAGAPPISSERSTSPSGFRALDARDLRLREVTVRVRASRAEAPLALALSRLEARSDASSGLVASASGRWNERPFEAELTGAELRRLLALQPWSYRLALRVGGAHALTTGVLMSDGGPLSFAGELAGDRLEELAALFQLELPPLGPYRAAGRVRLEGGRLHLTGLRVWVDASEATGELLLDLTSVPRRLQGRLQAKAVDLAPWLGRLPGRQATSRSENGEPKVVAPPPEAWELSLAVDAEAIEGTPLPLSNLSGHLSAEAGVWWAEGTIILGGLPARVQLEMSPAPMHPQWTASLMLGPGEIDRLTPLVGLPALTGSIQAARAELGAAGSDLRSLLASLSLAAELQTGYLRYGGEDGAPVPLTLTQGELRLEPGQPLELTASGSLRAEPFELHLQSDAVLAHMAGQPWPLKVRAHGGGANIQVEGLVTPERSDLRVAVSGKRVGDLADWLGVAAEATAPYALQGKLSVTPASWSLVADAWSLGKSRGRGRVARHGESPATWQLMLRADAIDAWELATVAPSRSEVTGATPAPSSSLPLLPQDLRLDDVELDLHIGQLALGEARVDQLALVGGLREGRLSTTQLAFALGPARFAGELSANLEREMPQLTARLDGSEVDLGVVVARLGGVSGLDGWARTLTLDLDLRGATLDKLLARSSLRAELREAYWRLHDPGTGKTRALNLTRAALVAEPGRPTSLDLAGDLDAVPLSARGETAGLAQIAASGKQGVPVQVIALLPDATLSLEGSLPWQLPSGPTPLETTLYLRGEHLEGLNGLLQLDLPPLGPYSLAGRLRIDRETLQLSELRIQLGVSDLSGRADLVPGPARPKLNLDLHSRHLELDDFVVAGWSPIRTAEPRPVTVAATAAASTKVSPLLSRANLSGLDLDLKLQADRISLGGEPFGAGELAARVADGRLAIKPLDLDLSSGFARAELDFAPEANGATIRLVLDVDDLDYGVPARWVSPGSRSAGLLSLGVDLTTSFELLEPVLAHANGRFDVRVLPRGIQANAFDLWATNLLFALLPSLDSEGSSHINCLQGRFDMEDGQLQQELLLIDTTKVRVVGSAKVDFRKETVTVSLVPRPKRPQFLAVATPVRASGKFSDFKFRVTSLGLAESIARLTYYWVDVPLQWLFQGSLPEDGADVCHLPPRRPINGRPTTDAAAPG